MQFFSLGDRDSVILLGLVFRVYEYENSRSSVASLVKIETIRWYDSLLILSLVTFLTVVSWRSTDGFMAMFVWLF